MVCRQFLCHRGLLTLFPILHRLHRSVAANSASPAARQFLELASLSNEAEVVWRQAEGGRFSHTQAVLLSMAPSDQTEMPYTPGGTQIKGRLLAAFPSFRLGALRVAIRGRMPVVEDHEVIWTEESDEDDDGDGVSEESSPRESLGAVIESVLHVAGPPLPDPCFLERVAVEEGDDKSVSSSGENSSRLAMDTEFHQVILDVPAGITARVGLAERDEAAVPPFSF